MKTTTTNLVQYWRACKSDGDLKKGSFSRRDLKSLEQISISDVERGTLSRQLVQRLFRDQPRNVYDLEITLRPIVLVRKMNSAPASTITPDIIAPVMIDGLLNRNGEVRPSQNSIARDLLTPLRNEDFSIGSLESLDSYLSKNPLNTPDGADTASLWDDAKQHWNKMLKVVAGDWLKSSCYEQAEFALIQVIDDVSAASVNTIKLYDALLRDKTSSPLLDSFALSGIRSPQSSPEKTQRMAARLGHSNEAFPLAKQQREVIAHLSVAGSGEIIASNGPPGTGKTTMLLSVIAGMWAKAAIEEEDPPVIAAASMNNQAVTNIIDAFGKDFSKGDGVFAGRWLPDLNSFGFYLPSRRKSAEAAKKYQIDDTLDNLENETYILKAKTAYLEAASIAFPHIQSSRVKDFTSALRKLMSSEMDTLSKIDSTQTSLSDARSLIAELGSDPESELKSRKTSELESTSTYQQAKDLAKLWNSHLAAESTLATILSFLPSVRRKRLKRAQLFLDTDGDFLKHGICKTVDEIEGAIASHTKKTKKTAEEKRAYANHAENLILRLARAEENWSQLTLSLEEQYGSSIEAGSTDDFADRLIRFPLFLLATHYWEGRWLLEVEDASEEDLKKMRKKQGKDWVIKRWRRRMMIAPCCVSTFAMLPSKMTYTTYEAGSFTSRPLYSFIDLLIVDEAGQVSPENAAASFALAKNALVIGDTQQIEPISNLTPSVDIGNLVSSNVLQGSVSEEDLEQLTELGVMSHNGSVMKVAQNACKYHPYPDLERGLYLFEHRRCYDEIISFCNDLCYKGALQPLRGPAGDDGILPAMGYLHIDGICTSAGGSRRNEVEAQVIAAWLSENREKLESKFKRKLEDIVGVVTPFGSQKQAIKKACGAQGIRVDEKTGMTIGTVHALQGAEREVVIFSSVYSKQSDGSFIDLSKSMLNVAASRAKSSFLVFGDMDTFSNAASSSPRGVLAGVLFANSDQNALTFKMPFRQDLQSSGSDVSTLENAQDHDAFLLQTLKLSAQKVSIASPWIVLKTLKDEGIFEALVESRRRGTKIEVFVDPSVNNNVSQFETATQALKDIGVDIYMTRQIHSKVVAADDHTLCLGSYNWLSAQRNGPYTRHEASMVCQDGGVSSQISSVLENLSARVISAPTVES